MPDVSDATEVVTDPKNVVDSDSHSDERRVNAKRATRALRNLGASKAEARLLITAAVEELDGRVGAEVQTGARGAGPDTHNAADTWFIPASAVRKPSKPS